MKIRKIQFPAFEMLLFAMLCVCGIVISSLLILANSYSLKAKMLNEAVTCVKSVSAVYLVEEDENRFCQLVSGNKKDNIVTIDEENGQIVVELGENIAKFTYISDAEVIYEVTIKRVGGVRDEEKS